MNTILFVILFFAIFAVVSVSAAGPSAKQADTKAPSVASPKVINSSYLQKYFRDA
jgi:hypothetical protein